MDWTPTLPMQWRSVCDITLFLQQACGVPRCLLSLCQPKMTKLRILSLLSLTLLRVLCVSVEVCTRSAFSTEPGRSCRVVSCGLCCDGAGADYSLPLGRDLIAEHPRYVELVTKYGSPAPSTTDAGAGSMSASVVKVTLRSMAGCTFSPAPTHIHSHHTTHRYTYIRIPVTFWCKYVQHKIVCWW